MNKLILSMLIVLPFFGCQDNCPDEDPSCPGMYEYIDGECQCPEGTVDIGAFRCADISSYNYWFDSGDNCLRESYFFIKAVEEDPFNPDVKLTRFEYRERESFGTYVVTIPKIELAEGGYTFTREGFSLDPKYGFQICNEEKCQYYDMEIVMNPDWVTMDITLTFWNDLDTSLNVEKDIRYTVKGEFRNDKGPKE